MLVKSIASSFCTESKKKNLKEDYRHILSIGSGDWLIFIIITNNYFISSKNLIR